jgi:salicylate hydroxylase
VSDAHAVVAGAGIGGLTAALCLARAGLRVTILEKAATLEPVGAGLQLSPNASAVLRNLGVLPRLDGLALRPAALHIRRARDGATLARAGLADAERRWGAPYLLAHRGDLQAALLAAVADVPAISLVCGTAVTGFAAAGSGLRIATEKGDLRGDTEADCLIGADGLHSAVRGRLVDRPDPLRSANRTAWRALIPAAAAPADARAPDTALWLGEAAHVVHYPLRGGSVVNVVVIVGDARTSGDGPDFWSQPGDAAVLARRLSGFAPGVQNLVAAAPAWRCWPLADRDPLPRWQEGPVALLGDAAHPMLPFLAQGAAQAIEDAAALGLALATLPVPAALARYEAMRREKATRLQIASRRQGRVYHLGGPAAFARDLAIRAAGPRLLARYDWVYRQRP